MCFYEIHDIGCRIQRTWRVEYLQNLACGETYLI